MTTFKIPVTWEVYGEVRIEANSLDEAIAKFDESEDQISLPTDNDYVDGSFKREDEEVCSLHNDKLEFSPSFIPVNKKNIVHHYKSFDGGFESWNEYDESGNIIHYKNSYGYEYWREYNVFHNEIHYKNSYGYEYWREYDERGNEIHYKNSDDFEDWREYDENNNEIHYKNSDGREHWREYDKRGNPFWKRH